MALISASVDAFVVTSIAVVAPIAYFFHRRSSSSEASYRKSLNVLVFRVLHTIYILYNLMLKWPPNLFQRLHIPLTMPSDTIRIVLLQKAGLAAGVTLPKALENLLTRLSSFDIRTLYVRFGQTVLQDCEYCTTYDEFALYALPGPLLEYVREAAVIGLLTINGSNRERWRTYAVAALVCAAVLEGYWISSAPVRIPRDGLNVFMLHDNLWVIRQLFFLLLPLLIHILPPSIPSPSPTTALLSTQTTLQTTLTHLTSLKYLRGAIMRDPSLRSSAIQWWDSQKVRGEWVREDEAVRRMAEKLGYGFDIGGEEREEGKLRSTAKMAASALTAGIVPAPNVPPVR